MRISRCIFLVIFLFAATQLRAQSSESFVPILDDTLVPSAEFVDGETTVTEIEIVGLDPEGSSEGRVYASDFIKQLREERIFFLNDKFSGYKVHLITKKVKEWLSEYGYESAKVTALGMRLPENQTRLRFSVDRGPLIATKAIRFMGSERIPSTELEENLKGCLGDDWERYDRKRYDYFTQKCSRELYFSKGFFRARIVEIKSEIRDGARDVVVFVTEGHRYRYGKITIDGNQAFSDREILEFFGQKSGDIANGENLKDFVYERLKQKYGELGYVQYNAEFEPKFLEPSDEKSDGVVNILLTIEEGRPFTVRRIKIDGVEPEEGRKLLTDFPMKSGDLFVPGKLEEWAEAINKTGRFNWFDKDQHVKILSDVEAADVDLVISLKKVDQ
jgi:outer membrane protein assembly factor BamA